MLTKRNALEKRQLPNEFTNVASQGAKMVYDSLELCKKNAKLRHSLNEIYVLSFETVMKLIEDVRVYIGSLYKVCEGIAMIDMVTGFSAPLIARSRLLHILPRQGRWVNSIRLLVIDSSTTRV
jgi:DNA mismatch repair protein MSH4